VTDLASRREEIATVLNAVNGLRPVQDEGLMPDKLNLPTCIVTVADDAQPMNLTLTEFAEHFEVVLVHSLRGGKTRSERSLAALYADVVEALVSDLDWLVSIQRQGYGVIEMYGVDVLGAILRLEVIDQ